MNAGITEANPHLVAPGPQPGAFTPWRDRLQALQPRYLRILVDWRRVQPTPSQGPDWSQPADGCLRGIPPCAAFSGIADELRAAAAAQMVPVIVILGTPDWAASPPAGCESERAGAAARMPADLEAYRVLIRSLLELGAGERIALPWWSPWNEPNHPLFFGPQRAACDADRAPQSPDRYAELVRAARAELDAAPGDQRIVLGEVAGFDAPRANAVGSAEFARALPDDVVCGAGVWAQHAYAKVAGELAADAADPAAQPGAPRILRGVTDALDAHACPGGPLPVWITETGASSQDGRDGCEAMARALAVWSDDPRVDVAFQYTFREDTAFRVGLANPRLTRLEPAYGAWRALATGGLGDPAAACAGQQ
ncbi:hypothetical protein [Capillimicrobium parvum]|uniref:Asl1-like glycosyl hydrolase catalytic domain-containing protein n=1 Tax=Capillimicrobium parvum TaxID=2884022 RepID=A0A9E6Y1B0_9ACTN|nr:hypothetical protein [Capillimicrobium parvum]UGS38095.1 hypothetical protein DSM104329_04517 [Capillimicrobium parvum]